MEIIRGDNKTFRFQRKDSDGNVIEYPASEVFVTIKDNSYQTPFHIQKKLSDGTITFNDTDFYYRFEILPEDTDSLSYGNYEFDIERIYLGKKKTILVDTFTITKEITFASNEVEEV